MPQIFPGQGGAICLCQRSAQSSQSRVRGRGRVSIRFPGEPSALERGPLLLRKEATFSPRSPRKSVARYVNDVGILFSFPGDWRRQILKIVLELELVRDC
jgi:hypothetical protein